MIQPIYTSVTNADVKPCHKGKPISCEPIPLLRNNYLGEYRTELEKAKVRANLGIADEASLLWGNITGTIGELKDLVLYVESTLAYTPPDVEGAENIKNVKDALDYALNVIKNYDDNNGKIEELETAITSVSNKITTLESDLNSEITANEKSFADIDTQIADINTNISVINDKIKNINVDENIQNWITKSLSGSKTIEKKEDNTLEVILSTLENNAIHLIEQVTDEGTSTDILPGIYVEDLKPALTETKSQVESNTTSINNILNDLETIDTYQTDLPDNTTSTVVSGTTVELLRDKSFSEIIDTLIFPTYVRPLEEPTLEYSSTIPELVEVGLTLLTPTLTFTLNDAGAETSRKETVTYNGSAVSAYNSIGTYTHTGTVNYEAGEYLINNKGETTNLRIEAGSITATVSTTATYPWYAGNVEGVSKQVLVPFNLPSGVLDFSLSGRAVVKLPGSNSLLISFTVDGGLGYLPVDLKYWVTSTETINGFTYKVWTKNDSYSSVLLHKINFTLLE